MPPEEIRIVDLAHPVLDEAQKGALAAAAKFPVDLDVEGILKRAVENTGLDDFGAMDFTERLSVWMQSVDEDADLSPIGRISCYRDAVRRCEQRLRIEDLLRRHPEILEIEIERPLIIVGLPRSGTTHMVNLIAADRRLRSLPLWESMEPVPTPHEGPGHDGLDARFIRCRDTWAASEALTPHMQAMHPMPPEHIHEELELMHYDFSSYDPEWRAHLPRWRDYYLSLDQRPHYAYLKKVLKVCTWFRGPSRWVLKSPQHLEQIGPLYETFPDATVVFTHRDPTSVMASTMTMMAYSARITRTRVDVERIAEYWTDRIEKLLTACVRDRALVPREHSFDSLFHEFMADDIGTIERIYEVAGLSMTRASRRALEDYMLANPRGKHGRMVYDLEGDFGLDRAALQERFAFYIDRFGCRRGA